LKKEGNNEIEKDDEMVDNKKELYSLILENANDLISIINEKLEYEYVNENAYLKILGYSKDDLIGKTRTDLIHPDDLQLGLELIQKAFNSDEHHQMKGRFKHKDGHYIWCEVKGKSFIDEKGEKKGLIIGRDISESKEAEIKLKKLNEELEQGIEERTKKLMESEEQFRIIADHLFMGNLIIHNNSIIYANDVMLDMLEVSAEEFVKKSPFDFFKLVHPDDKKAMFENFVFAQENKQIKGKNPIFRLITKSGKTKHLQSFARIIPLEGKSAILGTFLDVTKRKITEQKLIESEEKFRRIAEQSIIGIGILQDNVFKYVNDAAVKIIGYTAEEIMSWKPYGFAKRVHPDDLAFTMEQARKKQIGEKLVTVHYTFRIITKSGKIKWIDNYSKTIEYEGRPANFMTILDNTEKIENEHKLQESELKYRVAFDRAEFYKDLLSHDFSNIFQNILATSELAISYLNDPYKAKEKLIAITKQVERAGRLNSNIRILSEIDKKKSKLKSIDVKAYLDNSISFVRDSFSEKKINIQVKNLEDNPPVQANELLYDVFENIMINAIQHNNNEKINIEIKIYRIQKQDIKYIKMEFRDNGMGVHDSMKNNIFNRGFREERSIQGMGIGLSLLKRIMKRYKGEIFVQDKILGDFTKGSNFVLLLREVEH